MDVTRGSITIRGEHRGLTTTSLLGGQRLDSRLPGFENTLWLKINRVVHRRYLNRNLRIYHTEVTDRIARVQRTFDLARKVSVFSALGEDLEYLHLPRRVDQKCYRRVRARVMVARLLAPIVALMDRFGR
jgi:hypothetical protein